MSKFILQFEFDFHTNGWDHAIALIKYADTLGIDTAAAATTHYTPPATKTAAAKPAPAAKAAPAAAKAAAPAAKPKAAAAKPAPAPAKDALDLNGSGADDEEETGGLGLGDMFDAPEDFKGTPEEAKEEALGILRVMLGNGHKAHVKEVQQIMKVAKFHDVPPEHGFDFLKRVKEVQAKI